MEIGGLDGAARTISLVQTELAPAAKDNFFVGMLPEAMNQIPDTSWDIVVCNSVFQSAGSAVALLRSRAVVAPGARIRAALAVGLDRSLEQLRRDADARVRLLSPSRAGVLGCFW